MTRTAPPCGSVRPAARARRRLGGLEQARETSLPAWERELAREPEAHRAGALVRVGGVTLVVARIAGPTPR